MSQITETADQSGSADVSGTAVSIRRFLPLAILAAGIATFFGLGLDRYVTFETLREHRHALTTFVDGMPVAGALIFIGLYALSTAFSLPGGAVLTVAGGFLFGAVFGATWVVLGATAGALAVFLAAKTALGTTLRERAGPWLRKMEAGFQENAFSYLLVLRLIPLFPFFVVNLVPAFLGMRLRSYAIATFIGIIPGSFVFATVGAGLGSIFDSAEEFTLAGVLTPEVIAAMVGLAILSLLPVAYKLTRSRRSTA